MKARALILFSGGLDSILAAKVLTEQGIKATGITFRGYFFDAVQAKEAAEEIGLALKVVNFSAEHLKMVKRPRYGYGKAMNPCIDCHILMLRTAKEIMRKEGFDFIATGEVLGERPMSQNKRALNLIEKESGLTGYLLRPLSAKLFKPTIPEKLGQVDREKLLDISGRSRKRQIALAEKYKIKRYPTPAGGCLLTDFEFSERLRELLKICPKCDGSDIELLKYGRHFWEANKTVTKWNDRSILSQVSFTKKVKIVVGRNEQENKKIKKLKRKGDILIEMKNYPGPLTLIRFYDVSALRSAEQKILSRAKKLTQRYSSRARNKRDVEFQISA